MELKNVGKFLYHVKDKRENYVIKTVQHLDEIKEEEL
jgi:hypothetical protein